MYSRISITTYFKLTVAKFVMFLVHQADILEVKHAVSSAVDVMQSMGSSICSLLSKVSSAYC